MKNIFSFFKHQQCNDLSIDIDSFSESNHRKEQVSDREASARKLAVVNKINSENAELYESDAEAPEFSISELLKFAYSCFGKTPKELKEMAEKFVVYRFDDYLTHVGIEEETVSHSTTIAIKDYMFSCEMEGEYRKDLSIGEMEKMGKCYLVLLFYHPNKHEEIVDCLVNENEYRIWGSYFIPLKGKPIQICFTSKEEYPVSIPLLFMTER